MVTGGAGFIGSHLIKWLLCEGHEVVCLDTFDPYYNPQVKRQNIARFLSRKSFKLIEGNINDKIQLTRAIEGCEVVFHEAAQAGVRVSVADPLKTHNANATGTLALLQASVEAGVKKLINASSSSVYGIVQYLPFDEKHPTFPISPYGVTKLIAEHYCRVFSELYGIETVSLRYFTVYGPRMRPDLAISIFTSRAIKGQTIEIFGDGNKTRDLTYIDDVIRANLIAMHRGTGVYNIGCGYHISIGDLAREIISATGSASQISFSPYIAGDVEHTCANTQKAERELGWHPEVTLKDGLRRYIEWVSNCQS